MGDVEPIRKDVEPPAVEPVFPGVEAALVVSISEKQSLSIKTMFLRDTKPQDHERVMASLFCVSAVVALREKLIELKNERANAQRRLASVSVDPEKRETLEQELQGLQAEKTEYQTKAEAKFRANGRSGAFVAAGADRTKLNGLTSDIFAKANEIKSLDGDTKIQREQLEKAIHNYGIAIELTESEIAIRREAYGE